MPSRKAFSHQSNIWSVRGGKKDKIALVRRHVFSTSEARFKLALELTQELICIFFSYLLHRGVE